MSGAWRIRSCLNKLTVLMGKASNGSNKQWVKQCPVQFEKITMNKWINQLKHWEWSNWKCIVNSVSQLEKLSSWKIMIQCIFSNFSKTSQLLWSLLGVCTAVMDSIIISLFVKSVVVISWLHKCSVWSCSLRTKFQNLSPHDDGVGWMLFCCVLNWV